MTATAQFRDEAESPGIATRIGDFGRGLKDQFFKGGGKGPWWKLRVSTIIALSVPCLSG